MKRQIVKHVVKLTFVGAALTLPVEPAHATDPRSEGRLHVASVGDGGTSIMHRPAPRDTESTRDLRQLVQNTPADQGGPAQDGAENTTILAAFHTSTPESTEEELAKQHGLEIVRRMTLPSLDLRVVTYRARHGSASAEIVQRLRADPRVSSAQVNVAYRAVEPDDTKVSQSAPPLGTSQKGANPPAPISRRAPTQSAGSDAVGQSPKPKVSSERVTTARGPVRVTAADVLAGGL